MFQNNRNKTEQQTKESSNFLFTLKVLSIKFKVLNSNKILRNTLLFTHYRQPADQQYEKYYKSFFLKTKNKINQFIFRYLHIRYFILLNLDILHYQSCPKIIKYINLLFQDYFKNYTNLIFI